MVGADVDEVVRVIGLHDSDDARTARRYFEESPSLSDDPRYGHIVCEDGGGQVVGVSGWGVDEEPADVYWLGWTYVNPWSEGRGVGRLLLAAVFDRVATLGGRRLFLDTSSLSKYDRAVRFYERNGFVRQGLLQGYYGPSEHKILMGRAILPPPG